MGISCKKYTGKWSGAFAKADKDYEKAKQKIRKSTRLPRNDDDDTSNKR